jgi:hypothetical protein
MRRMLALSVTAVLAASPAGLAQAPTPDAEVERGIRQAEDGDYDPAIVTLDAAARRLAGDPSRARDLSQAYLYLGIAYIGKGHEAAAKAKFREAVAQMKDLSLSPDKFPPKVIDLFEAARAEARAQNAPAPAPVAPTAATAAPVAKKKGGSKAILIVGGLAAVGGGVALAAGGGGGGGGSATTPTTPTTTLAPQPTFSGMLERADSVPTGEQRGYTVTATRSGTLEAKVTWQTRDIRLEVDCQESAPPYTQCSGTYVRTSDTTGTFTTPVQQKEYLVVVSNFSSRAGAESFTLQIRYP